MADIMVDLWIRVAGTVCRLQLFPLLLPSVLSPRESTSQSNFIFLVLLH